MTQTHTPEARLDALEHAFAGLVAQLEPLGLDRKVIMSHLERMAFSQASSGQPGFQATQALRERLRLAPY